MTDLKTLEAEVKKLEKQIQTILYLSGYPDDSRLESLEDYYQEKSADEWQQLETYQNILPNLDSMKKELEYYHKPIKEVSRINMKDGRYCTDKGHYYSSGSRIEFLRTKKIYSNDSDTWQNVEVWTCSRVENKDGKYYIVGYSNIEMAGLLVRVR